MDARKVGGKLRAHLAAPRREHQHAHAFFRGVRVSAGGQQRLDGPHVPVGKYEGGCRQWGVEPAQRKIDEARH